MKAIYTVITGNYDNLNSAPNFKGWDKILFCDNADIDTKGWQLRKLDKSNDPLLQSRDIKIRSHVHLKEYDLVCYIDGHQIFVSEPPPTSMWFMHSRRNNIFEEAKQIIKNGRFSTDLVNEQIEYYKSKGYKDARLYLNGFFVREHNEEINKLHDVWYEETKRFTQRDQLSLPYAIWKTGIAPKNIHREETKHRFAHVNANHKQ
jgi:hypothetical protein